MNISDYIRFALTAVILFQVCREAGFWTSLVIVFLAIANETNSYLASLHRGRIESLSFRLMLMEEHRTGATP